MLKKVLCCLVGTLLLSSHYNISNAQDNRVQYGVNAVVEKISSENFMKAVRNSIESVNGDYLDINIEKIEDFIDLESMIEQLENIKNHDRSNVFFNERIPSEWKPKIVRKLLYQNWQLKDTGFQIVGVLYDENHNIEGFVMECNVDDIHL